MIDFQNLNKIITNMLPRGWRGIYSFTIGWSPQSVKYLISLPQNTTESLLDEIHVKIFIDRAQYEYMVPNKIGHNEMHEFMTGAIIILLAIYALDSQVPRYARLLSAEDYNKYMEHRFYESADLGQNKGLTFDENRESFALILKAIHNKNSELWNSIDLDRWLHLKENYPFLKSTISDPMNLGEDMVV